MQSVFLWFIGISLFMSIAFQGVYLFFLHKQQVELRNYDFALTLILAEIEKAMGLMLKKNN